MAIFVYPRSPGGGRVQVLGNSLVAHAEMPLFFKIFTDDRRFITIQLNIGACSDPTCCERLDSAHGHAYSFRRGPTTQPTRARSWPHQTRPYADSRAHLAYRHPTSDRSCMRRSGRRPRGRTLCHTLVLSRDAAGEYEEAKDGDARFSEKRRSAKVASVLSRSAHCG